MSQEPVALIVSDPSFTLTYDAIAAGLARRGVRAVLVDTAAFPLGIQIEQRVDGGALTVGGERIDARQICGVWVKLMREAAVPDAWPASMADAVRYECRVAIRAFLGALDGAVMVNPIHVDVRVAMDKPYQLRVARAEGLNVAETLVTNDPAVARAAVSGDPSGWVCKLQTGVAPDGSMVFTQRLSEAALGRLDSLSACPMILQRWIPKRREIRVAWVDGACFAGALPGQKGGQDVVDWRVGQPGTVTWERAEVPPDVAAATARLMARLGLRYGGVDFIEDHDGRWWFLEVNPAGEWGMLEAELGLPIGDALAGLLTSGLRCAAS